jgi:hypothetical protein
MVAKFIVVFTATPLRSQGDGPTPRIVLVKEFAGRSPAAVDRHARAWFTSAHSEYRILFLDVHTQDEYETARAELTRSANGI